MKTSTFALVFGIAYLAAGLMGLVPAMLVPPPIDVPPTNFTLLYGYLLGLFPVNLLHSHDIWLHAVTALVAAYVGWRESADTRERRHAGVDRRQRMVPVAYERRFGLADRREHFGGMSPA